MSTLIRFILLVQSQAQINPHLMCICCHTTTMYVLTSQGALFDTETGLVKLRSAAVYMNIILTIYD